MKILLLIFLYNNFIHYHRVTKKSVQRNLILLSEAKMQSALPFLSKIVYFVENLEYNESLHELIKNASYLYPYMYTSEQKDSTWHTCGKFY